MRRTFYLVVVVCFGLIASFQSARGQCGNCPLQCPADDGNGLWTQVVDQQWTLPDGCVVNISYCYRDVSNSQSGDGWEREFYVENVTIVSGCSGMSIQDIIHEAADQLYQSISSLPQCNGPIAGKLVEITLNSCWEYNPMYEVQNCPSCKVYTGCGSGTCSKTCSICFGWDPVTETYHIFVNNCALDEQYASGCQEGPPSQGDWTAYTCYHLPCNW